MSGNKQRRFTNEFKSEAVRLMGDVPVIVEIDGAALLASSL